MRRAGEGNGRVGARKTSALASQAIDIGTCLSRVTVTGKVICPESINRDQKYVGKRSVGGRGPESGSADGSYQHQPCKPHTSILTSKKIRTPTARNLAGHWQSRQKRFPEGRRQLAGFHCGLKIQCSAAESLDNVGMIRGDVVLFSRIFCEIVQFQRMA